jgi:hypothetical protein
MMKSKKVVIKPRKRTFRRRYTRRDRSIAIFGSGAYAIKELVDKFGSPDAARSALRDLVDDDILWRNVTDYSAAQVALEVCATYVEKRLAKIK